MGIKKRIILSITFIVCLFLSETIGGNVAKDDKVNLRNVAGTPENTNLNVSTGGTPVVEKAVVSEKNAQLEKKAKDLLDKNNIGDITKTTKEVKEKTKSEEKSNVKESESKRSGQMNHLNELKNNDKQEKIVELNSNGNKQVNFIQDSTSNVESKESNNKSKEDNDKEKEKEKEKEKQTEKEVIAEKEVTVEKEKTEEKSSKEETVATEKKASTGEKTSTKEEKTSTKEEKTSTKEKNSTNVEKKSNEENKTEPIKEIIILDKGHVIGVASGDDLKAVVDTKVNITENEKTDNLIDEALTGESVKPKVEQSGLYFLQILSFMSSIFMQIALCPTIIKILKKKTTGELDGLPYVMLFYSSFLWLIYGMLIDNIGVVMPNFSGLVLGFLYSLAYHRNCKNMWSKQKLYSYYKICSSVTFLLYIFIYFTTFELYVLIVGLLASVSSVINFGAPLSSLREVIKKRDTSSMPLEMTVGSVICSLLWLLYGLILNDAFLIIPNLGGLMLGVLQVVLLILYYNKTPLEFIGDENFYNEEKETGHHKSAFFPNSNLEEDNRLSNASTDARDSFFDFSYDETSPLTSDFNYKVKPPKAKDMDLVKSSDSIDQVTALNF